jgi:4-hydroxy-3-methylbut-2-enyl diphosphate reductase IspH
MTKNQNRNTSTASEQAERSQISSPSSIRNQVSKRTHEIAVTAGRTPPYVIQEDYEMAKMQITGETNLELQNKIIYG